MHELSLADHLMKTADRYARENRAKSVCEITVQIGELSDIVGECLQTYHSMLRGDYELLKDSRLITETLPALCECTRCKTKYNPRKTGFACPACFSEAGKLIQGREFMIKEIKIKT